MSLESRLAAIRMGALKRVPASHLATMKKATQALRESGIMDGVQKVRDALSPFALTNRHGDIVRSVDLLARGPLVITMFRGSW